MATLSCAWCYRVSAGTGWSGVSILWPGEMKSWIWIFYLSVAAHKKVSRSVPEIHLRVPETLSNQQTKQNKLGGIGPVLGLVCLVAAHWDCVRQIWSAFSVSVWQHIQLSKQICLSVSPGMWVLHHCWEHSTGFQLKRGSNTKLLACAFSVSLTTPCHLTFLTFFIHTNHLECCALLTPLCFQFLASVWRPLAKDLSLFLAQLSGIPYLYLSEKLSVFQLSKRS